MPTLNLGIIGCGRISQLVHLGVLTRLPGAELVALAESDSERRAAASRRVPSARVFADYRELLADPDVQAVVICLPTTLHAKSAIAALDHDKHVYLEKPLATSLGEGRAVLAAWKRAGKTAMIGFNARFHPLVQSAKQQIESGRLGELVGARLMSCSAARALPEWKQRRQTGGGCLLDLASHQVDLLRFLLGQEVREVSAQVSSQHSEDDTATLQLRLADGVLAQAFCSLSAGDEHSLEIYGRDAKLTVDRHRSLNVEITPSADAPSRLSRLAGAVGDIFTSPLLMGSLIAPRREPSYAPALAHFVNAALHNQRARPDFLDGYHSLAVVLAAEESARSGRAAVTACLDEDFTR